MGGKLITVTEAARRIQVTANTIQRAFDAGKLKGIKTPGGRRRIYESEIERLMALDDDKIATPECQKENTAIAFGTGVWKNPTFQRLSIEARLFYFCALTYTSGNKSGGFIFDQDLPEIAIESGILNYLPVVEELIFVDELCDFGSFIPALLEVPAGERIDPELLGQEKELKIALDLPKSLWYKVEGGYRITGVATFEERFSR